MPQTLAQKILQAHTDDVIERDGQIVQCRLSLVLANDITGPLAIKSFKGMGASRVFDKDKIALVMDHFTPQKDIASANQVMISRQFAQEQGITHYYEGGDCGVEHTLLPERGLVGPGDVVIGADSQVLDSEVPVRQILEQLIARTGIPPFLLGLSWSSTERMSAQQADLLTSEITAIRRSLEPAVRRVCRLWLRLHGWSEDLEVEWEDINLQDLVEEARAELYHAQAEQIRKENT